MSNVKFVGVLNVTPDSFSDGGQFQIAHVAVNCAQDLFMQGAALVDVGAEATNPFVVPISADEEWSRLEPVLKVLLPKSKGKISVDSYHPETHRKIASNGWGDFIINDVTGFNNPDMVATAAELGMVCVVSHLPARFGTDIQAAHRANKLMDRMEDVSNELLDRHAALVRAGITKDKIILDPGIGFGKTAELNSQLLTFAKHIKKIDPNVRVMIGYSRKRFLGDHRMELLRNLEAGKVAIASGADYLRVHDIAGHMTLIKHAKPFGVH